MTTDEYVYAPAPPPPPKRAELISPQLQEASREAARNAGGLAKTSRPVGNPKVRPYPRTKIPSARSRLMMNRFAWGIDKRTAKQIRKAGGPKQWFEDQLRPSTVKDRRGKTYDGWYPDRLRSPANKWADV